VWAADWAGLGVEGLPARLVAGQHRSGIVAFMKVRVELGDITASAVEAVVTAANRSLAGGGGVDGAVHRAAGPRLVDALQSLRPCPPGEAVVTGAFEMNPPVRWIVHAVGPRYGVDEPAAELLASAYRAALLRCDEIGAASVAFPSLSTGAYGYPLLEACELSIQTLVTASTDVRLCVLVAL
jgi:O-acetyl-ADP-ribose deacetylase (regulator of RNase III)